MTEEAQRIALVSACPGILVRGNGPSGWAYRSSVAGRILPCIDGDPLQDLNALAEAEKILVSISLKAKYCKELNRLVRAGELEEAPWDWALIRARRERSQALLRSLNLWTES